MPSLLTDTPDSNPSNFFPPAWITTPSMRLILNAAPMGVVLLKAVRHETEQITDFIYQLVNPIQCALTGHPPEDMLGHRLTQLTQGVSRTGMMDRLIEVVMTGQPCQYVEEYRLDGVVGCYDQLYIKSGDGVLMLVQDVTNSPLSADERQQQAAFIAAIQRKEAVADLRARLVTLISGQRH